MTTPAPAPPQRTVWPYAIIAVFVLFAAYIGSMVYQAMRSDVDLVSADYYKQELAYQQRMESVALPLQPAAEQRQTINTSQMAPGLWRVQLDFTAGGQAYFFEQDLTLN